MGFWDFLRSGNAQSSLFLSPNVDYVGGPGWDEAALATGFDCRELSAAAMWRTQPHLRTVVSFLARNVAQLGLHTFERVDDVDRRRDRTSPVAVALRRPDTSMTGYDLMFALVGDMALYDTAYWLLSDDKATGAPRLRRLPPSWVSEVRSNPFEVDRYRITRNGSTLDVPADQVLAFNGYAPGSSGGVSPTIAALKETLQEQIEASRFRNQIWKRGGRVSSVLERPADAPGWSPEARESFREDWYAKYTGNGSKAGGTPILEDGMTLKRIDFSAAEQQFVEGAKLSFATVASAFHVNPTMVGLLDNANYSNVREFRRMLYGDTLGPLLAQIEDRVNTFLLPALGMDADRFYVEFNIAEKLQGSFEEQAQVMQTMVGAPIMTRNEGRAKFNLPAIADGNALVTPLNVLIGGQASPTDSGSQNLNAATADTKAALAGLDSRIEHIAGAVERGARKGARKAAPDPAAVTKAQTVLTDFFTKQERVVRSRLGAKDSAWWDGKRWDIELGGVVLGVTELVSTEAGRKTAERLGFTPSDYDSPRTLAFLKTVSDRVAGSVNAATQSQIQDALDAEDRDAALASVWAVAQGTRAVAAASSVTSIGAGFGTVEAARQVSGDRATKTWVTGKNPRPEHAAMNGQTVPVHKKFSNGADWPGDSGLDVGQTAGCNCSVSVEVS